MVHCLVIHFVIHVFHINLHSLLSVLHKLLNVLQQQSRLSSTCHCEVVWQTYIDAILGRMTSPMLSQRTCKPSSNPATNEGLKIIKSKKSEGRCCNIQYDVLRFRRVCRSRGWSTFGIYWNWHTHWPGTLMCIVYVREGVATFIAMSFGWQECVDQEEGAHLGSIKIDILTVLDPNVYCVCEGRCCNIQCDVLRLPRVCGLRGRSTFGIYQKWRTRPLGTLMFYIWDPCLTARHERVGHELEWLQLCW